MSDNKSSKATALSAYEEKGVVIVETGFWLWVVSIIVIIFLIISVGYGIYLSWTYPVEDGDSEDRKRNIVAYKIRQ